MSQVPCARHMPPKTVGDRFPSTQHIQGQHCRDLACSAALGQFLLPAGAAGATAHVCVCAQGSAAVTMSGPRLPPCVLMATLVCSARGGYFPRPHCVPDVIQGIGGSGRRKVGKGLFLTMKIRFEWRGDGYEQTNKNSVSSKFYEENEIA